VDAPAKPTGKLLNYTDEQVANLQPVYWMEQKQTVNLSGVSVTLDPSSGPPVSRACGRCRDTAIKDQIGKRRLLLAHRGRMPTVAHGYLEGRFRARAAPAPLAQSDSIS